MTNPEPHTTGQRVSSSWLTDLRAAEEAATPGPWQTIQAEIYRASGHLHATLAMTRGVDCRANAEFIVAMRNALPQLLAAAEAIERVRALHRPSRHKRAITQEGTMRWVGVCVECREHMPCPTVRALDPEATA